MKWILLSLFTFSATLSYGKLYRSNYKKSYSNIYCEILSELSFPTGDFIRIFFDSQEAEGNWYKSRQHFLTLNGNTVTALNDPIVDRFKQVTGKITYGFKFEAQHITQKAFIRVILLNEVKNWVSGYFVLSTPPDRPHAEENIIATDDLRCKYY